jgi:hypothetical protein
MSLNRIVVLLTPVFAALAGWLTEWVAQHFPGTPNLDKGQLTVLFVAGATFAFGKAALWLHGWQKHEAYELHAAASVPPVDPGDGVKHTGL